MEKQLRNLLTALVAITFAFVFTSCGNKQENAIKKQIGLMNDYADEFEKDPKSDNLAKIEEKILAMEEEMKNMSDPSKDQEKELFKKYGPEMGKAATRYMEAKMGTTLGSLPDMLKGIEIKGLTE